MKTNEKSKINPYDLGSVGKSLHRNGVKNITVFRGNDPYNAGGVATQNSSNQRKDK
jgi:hypothetical protein